MDIQQMLLGNKPNNAAFVNEDAFKEPLSPLGMYFLGLLYTDGCIFKHKGSNRYVMQLALSKNDLSVLEKFSEFLNYSGNITYRPPSKVFFKHSNKEYIGKGLYILRVSSTLLCNSLIKLGVSERKTKTLTVPDRLVGSINMWRGVIDGDGCLSPYTYKDRIFRVILISGSEKFVDQFKEFCMSYNFRCSKFFSDRTWRLGIIGKHAFNLATLLYKDCCYAIPRKLAIYNQEVERCNTKAQYWNFSSPS